jgi:uncharacterized lipoprotein YddW (UPF0748 family)
MKLLQTFNLPKRRGIVHWYGRFAAAFLSAIMAGIPPAAAQSGTASLSTPCAVWVVRNALGSRATWLEALAAVERVGCRRIYLQVSGRWDAYYPSRVFPPPVRNPSQPGWEDPFGEAVESARSRGLEVHAWVNAMLAWSAPDPPPNPSHVYRRRPEWFIVDRSGRSIRELSRGELDRAGLVGEGWFLDPAQMEVRTELRRFVLELALRYPVEGVHLDYIRYPSGWAPESGSSVLTYLVGLIHDDLALARPEVTLSAAVMPIPAEADRWFGQDWNAWLEHELVAEVVPMAYRDRPEDVLGIVREYPPSVARAKLWIGVRLDRLNPTEARQVANGLALDGVAGQALFSHNLLLEDPAWRMR